MTIKENIRKILKETTISKCDFNRIYQISDELSKILHCDIHGSCVHFAELFVELIHKNDSQLLNCFYVVEGYVDTPIGDGYPQQHTWIELLNGEIIDPTFLQFSKYGDASYLKNSIKKYSGVEYYEDGKNGSWFSEKRKKHPEIVFKNSY